MIFYIATKSAVKTPRTPEDCVASAASVVHVGFPIVTVAFALIHQTKNFIRRTHHNTFQPFHVHSAYK